MTFSPNFEAGLSYRRSSIQEASPAGLVVILYDLLIADLQAATAAMRDGRIEDRCARLKHGLLVLQVLESSLDLQHGGETALILSRFYAYLRKQMLDAHCKREPTILEEAIALFLEVREAWRIADSTSNGANGRLFAQAGTATSSAVENIGWSA
jgi:flagellar protein FliS